MDNIFAAVVDMETTGLNANENVPLEIAVAIIDKDGEVLDSTECLIWEMRDDFQNAVGRAQSNDFVNAMHTKSGLWEDLNNLNHVDLSIYSRTAVDDYLTKVLRAWGCEQGKVPMLGNSIGSLDRPFALVHLPKFNEHLSYRNIDMSTVKELVKAHNPKLWENLYPIIGDKSNATHRAIDDVHACIREYQAYIENFFFIED